MRNLIFVWTFYIGLIGCVNSKLQITPQYVTNYNVQDLDKLKIIEIYPKDKLMPPMLYSESKDFRYVCLFDSGFSFNSKILFNKPQNYLSWVQLPVNDSAWIPTYDAKRLDTLGQLKHSSWYLFKGLKRFHHIYAYIDKNGIAKIYEVNKANY